MMRELRRFPITARTPNFFQERPSPTPTPLHAFFLLRFAGAVSLISSGAAAFSTFSCLFASRYFLRVIGNPRRGHFFTSLLLCVVRDSADKSWSLADENHIQHAHCGLSWKHTSAYLDVYGRKRVKGVASAHADSIQGRCPAGGVCTFRGKRTFYP